MNSTSEIDCGHGWCIDNYVTIGQERYCTCDFNYTGGEVVRGETGGPIALRVLQYLDARIGCHHLGGRRLHLDCKRLDDATERHELNVGVTGFRFKLQLSEHLVERNSRGAGGRTEFSRGIGAIG